MTSRTPKRPGVTSSGSIARLKFWKTAIWVRRS
jgi:hypothetical protein